MSDIVVDDLDTMDNKMEIINYAYCKHSQMKTVPQVFINRQVRFNTGSSSVSSKILQLALM